MNPLQFSELKLEGPFFQNTNKGTGNYGTRKLLFYIHQYNN